MQKYFSENFDTTNFKVESQWWHKRWLYFSTSLKKVDENCPGTQPTWSIRRVLKQVLSSSIFVANLKIAAVFQSSASGAKEVRRMYLQISAEGGLSRIAMDCPKCVCMYHVL